MKKLLHTPLYKHLKNNHRVQFVADILRAMNRWGLLSDKQLDDEINRLQVKLFTLECGEDILNSKK